VTQFNHNPPNYRGLAWLFSAFMNKRNLLVLCGTVLSLSIGLMMSGCKQQSGDVIKVGEFASLTGKEATFGTSSHEGTLLAMEELNAAGGVLGKKIELITEDDLSKPGEAATVVNKLIARDGVAAILGEVASSRSLEAAPICQDNRIPMISPSSTNPKVTETGNFIFRVCFTDILQGRILATFAEKTLRAKKVALFTDVKSDYSKGLARYFKESFLASGGQIAAELDFNGGDKDFKAQLTAIKSSAPDAIFIPGYYTDVALICIQAKQLGVTVPIFGGDGWESEDLVKIGKEAVEGTYFSTHCAADSPGQTVKKFVEVYRKRFRGKSPDAMAMLGYDSALILADAMKRAGSTDGDKVRAALAATKDFGGVSGKITIDEKRDATKPMVILQVKGGEFRLVETVNP
jgi:branched-chain amino acid transport system substrate-binding protein